MNDAAGFQIASAGATASRDRQWVILWAIAVALVYAAFGYLGVRTMSDYAAEARASRMAMFVSPGAKTGAAMNAPEPTAGAASREVLVGARLNQIRDVVPTEGAWTADFTIWFRWDDPALAPGNDFRIVDGQIIQQDKLTSVVRAAGRYEEYHVVARISQPFDALRFPFGNDVVLVRIEDKVHGLDRLHFVVDARNTGVAPDAMPPNADLSQPFAAVKTHAAPGGSADAALASEGARSRSQFVFGAVLEPNGLNIAVRLFQALLVSVAVALLALFIKPVMIDCRFGLPIGAFFASVSNNAVVASVVPRAGGRTLGDLFTTLSLMTIFLVLVQSVIALYAFDTLGREQAVRKFDRVSFVVIVAGYVVVGVLLPLAARLR